MNKVILIGRLTQDSKANLTASGVQYLRNTVAVNRNTSSNQEITDFVPVVAWRQIAQFIENYAPKGTLVAIEGSLFSNQYTNKEGKRVVTYEVNIDNINLLESRQIREQRQSQTQSYSANNSSYSVASKPPFTEEPKFGGYNDDQNSSNEKLHQFAFDDEEF